jgi:glycosyltransferase involved in cell wall biosynthesis
VISLIVATLDRVAELDRLLGSLEAQSYPDFEVIVVDQNADNRLVPVLLGHTGVVVRHLRSERGLSRARNTGLHAARGDIMAFPDDDCWYPAKLLESIANWFELHPEFALLNAALRTADNLPATKSPAAPRRCAKSDVSKCVSSATLFLRRTVPIAIGGFNEKLGIGAPSEYKAGEERDYVLRALEHGFQLWYEPSLTVHHPSLYSREHQLRATYTYALSEGCVQRLHHCALPQIVGSLVRSFGGAAVRLCQGDLLRARVCALRGAGQLLGYVFGPRRLARVDS